MRSCLRRVATSPEVAPPKLPETRQRWEAGERAARRRIASELRSHSGLEWHPARFSAVAALELSPSCALDPIPGDEPST